MSEKNEIVQFDKEKHFAAILEIAYKAYRQEMSHVDNLHYNSESEFMDFVTKRVDKMQGVVYLIDGYCKGYLFGKIKTEDEKTKINIPEWGYGAEEKHREKIICKLFQTLTGEMTETKKLDFSVRVYAHDMEMQRLFSYMEFGIQAEIGVQMLKNHHIAELNVQDKKNIVTKSNIRPMEKAEMEERWSEVWSLLSKLIDHLKQSPIFYPGEEFTEEVYQEFFMDEETNVYIAEDDNLRLLGLIETNGEQNRFVSGQMHSANIGEAYVLPEYRGSNLAQALLQFAEEELANKNCDFAWVEHGTANPNARGFWNKYFSTYEYEMIRHILFIQ